MLHESIHRCIIFFSKTPVEQKKTIWETNPGTLKQKNQSTTTPPPATLQVGVGGVFFFRSHPGGNAAGGGLMEAELES